MTNISQLAIDFAAWTAEQGLPQVDAMELLAEDITDYQRSWLTDFVERWELAAEAEQNAFKLIGHRVRLVATVDNFPTCMIKAGETGTVREVDFDGSIWVTLDAAHPELDEWENAVQIWDHEMGDALSHIEQID